MVVVMTPRVILEFMAFAEPLKNVLRHSYTSAGRRESVAEHSWMLCLLALSIFDELQVPVDQLKVLKMLILHDLPEVITGDIPTFDKQAIAAEAHAEEMAAIEQLTAPLPPKLQAEVRAILYEYEARQTLESQVAYAIDKAEAFIQHNLADIATWEQKDFDYQTNWDHPIQDRFAIDPFLQALKQQIDLDTLQKVEAAGQLEQANPAIVDRYLKMKTSL